MEHCNLPLSLQAFSRLQASLAKVSNRRIQRINEVEEVIKLQSLGEGKGRLGLGARI